MSHLRYFARRIKLRHLLIGFLVAFGSVPLIVSSTAFIVQNRKPLEIQERLNLSNRAEALSRELSDYILSKHNHLRQLGTGLLSLPERPSVGATMRRDWVNRYLRNSMMASPEFPTRLVDLRDDLQFGPQGLPEAVQLAMNEAFQEVVREGAAVFQFVLMPDQRPAVIIAEPVFGGGDDAVLRFVVEGVAELPLAGVPGDVFLIGREGEVLWTEEESEEVKSAVSSSRLVRDYLALQAGFIPVYEYTMKVDGQDQSMIGQLSPVEDAGWGVLVQQPRSAAFDFIRKMRNTTVISAIVMVLLALICAPFATRLISHPIQHLAETSKEIAAGNFGHRAEPGGIGMEIADLAESFNLMSGHVQDYVDQLRAAARQNRDLFIGSIRAFLTAIEAKEPYTRGHSERVASYSQSIAQRMNLSREFQERIWVAGLLHDVGKIGIDDRILKKGDLFTDEEYEKMKLHTVIGAEIMSPIEQLREMLPVIRWHHERWNGTGYPDGLKGDRIPLIARIVGVADTFDAVTTQRVYQDPYAPDDAVENIIRKASGTSFDPAVVDIFVACYEAGEVRVRQEAKKVASRERAKVTAAIHT